MEKQKVAAQGKRILELEALLELAKEQRPDMFESTPGVVATSTPTSTPIPTRSAEVVAKPTLKEFFSNPLNVALGIGCGLGACVVTSVAATGVIYLISQAAR